MSKYSIDESWKFWLPLVTDSTGNIVLEKVQAELHDFYVAMHEVPKVYCHITGDRLSKITYYADTVIAAADEYYESLYEGQQK